MFLNNILWLQYKYKQYNWSLTNMEHKTVDLVDIKLVAESVAILATSI